MAKGAFEYGHCDKNIGRGDLGEGDVGCNGDERSLKSQEGSIVKTTYQQFTKSNRTLELGDVLQFERELYFIFGRQRHHHTEYILHWSRTWRTLGRISEIQHHDDFHPFERG